MRPLSDDVSAQPFTFLEVAAISPYIFIVHEQPMGALLFAATSGYCFGSGS